MIGQLTGGLGREFIKLNQAVTAPFTGEEPPTHKIEVGELAARFFGKGGSGSGAAAE